MKILNVPKNDKERNIFQNFLKRSQKINVNDQNSIYFQYALIFNYNNDKFIMQLTTFNTYNEK